MNKEELNREYSSPFDINEQIYFCGVPFRLDTYNGCVHQCKYCFVRAQELTSANRKNKGQWILSADPDKVKHSLTIALDSNESREDAVTEWLRKRVPIHWGGMSDPFQSIENHFGASKSIMEYLSWYEYPTVISTKGTLLIKDEYLQLLKEGKYAVQSSIISDNEEFMKQIEPGAPLPKERLAMLEKLANNGIWTAVRIQPLIPSSIVEYELPEYIKRLAKYGIKHIVVEGYKVPIKAEEEMNFIYNLCPNTLQEYKYPDTKMEGFELILPSWRKWKYVKIAKQACEENGMTFGAGDNDMREFGNVICCCGVDNIKGFENFWRYQASQAVWIAKEKGFVILEDMQRYKFGEKGFGIHNEIIRNKRKLETGKLATPPWYAVNENWNYGGKDSPECMVGLKRNTIDGKLAYTYENPISKLESVSIIQNKMF